MQIASAMTASRGSKSAMEIKRLSGIKPTAEPASAAPDSASASTAGSPAAARRGDQPVRRRDHEIAQGDLIGAIERGVMSAKDDFGRALQMPVSALTSRPYHGQNVFLLAAAAQERGYESNAWCSYRAAQSRGWQVNKGEKGTRVFFFMQRELRTGKVDEETGEPETELRPVLRGSVVFNVAQIDTSKGAPVPDGLGSLASDRVPSTEARQLLDRIADEMGIEVRFSPDADATEYEDRVLTVASASAGDERHTASQLALGLLQVALQEGVRVRPRHSDPEVAEARLHLRQIMAESMLSMRLGFPIADGTSLDAGKVMLAMQSSKTAGSQAAGDAEAAVRYVLSFDPHLADALMAEGQAVHDEILDAAGENADQAFDATMIDFSYVEQRRGNALKP